MTTVSVVLPTRNRRDELLSTMRNVLAATHEDLVLHVFDNASTDGTREAVLSLALEDERIEYRRSERALSVADSFEAAYSHARADWVTGLGADDGFARIGIEELIRLARSERVEASSAVHASYHWPRVSNDDSGLVGIRHVAPDRVVESRTVVLEALSGMSTFQVLPTAYKSGIVSRRILEQLRRRNGRLFCSWNPDVYLGFAVARLVSRFALSGRPLTISGTSLGSTGRSSLGGGADQAPAEEFFRLSEDSSISLHPRISCVDGTMPRSLQIMTLEAFLQAGGPETTADRLLSAPVVQVALVLGGRRPTSDAVRAWMRRFIVPRSWFGSGRLVWLIAAALSRTVGTSYRIVNRLRRNGLQRGLGPVTTIAVEDHESMVRIARSTYGIHLSPAPPTLHEAAWLLDAALEFDAAESSATTAG